VVVARARAVARARTVARTRSECSNGGKGSGVVVEWLWIGGGEVARARVLAVELRWSGGGFMVARARPLCGSSFAAAALRQCSGGG
jgi:hypothetical protein